MKSDNAPKEITGCMSKISNQWEEKKKRRWSWVLDSLDSTKDEKDVKEKKLEIQSGWSLWKFLQPVKKSGGNCLKVFSSIKLGRAWNLLTSLKDQ